MFRKCIIKSLLIDCVSRGKEVSVAQRYLDRFYGIRASLNSLKRRVIYLRMCGRIDGCDNHIHEANYEFKKGN